MTQEKNTAEEKIIILKNLSELMTQEKEIKNQIADLKNKTKNFLNEGEKETYRDFVFTRTKETMRKTFDKAKFEKENPDLVEKYIKETKVSSSIRITQTKGE